MGRERSVGILKGALQPSLLLSLVHCTLGSVTQTHLLIAWYIVRRYSHTRQMQIVRLPTKSPSRDPLCRRHPRSPCTTRAPLLGILRPRIVVGHFRTSPPKRQNRQNYESEELRIKIRGLCVKYELTESFRRCWLSGIQSGGPMRFERVDYRIRS